MNTLQLVLPDASRHAAWLDSHHEWGPGLHEDGFGVGPDDDVESVAGFAQWVARLREGPGRLWWITDGERILGGIALRPYDDDQTQRHGHVGYGVRPSERGRGIATWALARVLDQARALGRDHVDVVCLAENAGSIATIERCGGVLRLSGDDGDGPVRHYRIEL